MVWSDNSHPLHGQLQSQLIPRGSGRLGLLYAGTNRQIRHPFSFIPNVKDKVYRYTYMVMLVDNVRRLKWEGSLHTSQHGLKKMRDVLLILLVRSAKLK